MNSDKQKQLSETKQQRLYELTHALGKEQLIFNYQTLEKPIIEISFEASCSHENVVAFLKVGQACLNISCLDVKCYLVQIALMDGQSNVDIIFEKEGAIPGSVYLKNIEIQFVNQFQDVDKEVTYIAHRGFSKLCPENTMPSFYKAAQLGYRKIETDVVTTSDGEWVLLHDDTINRTSNGSGKITEMTLAQVRGYDFGSYKGAAFCHTHIPTFEEFIQFCQRYQIHPYIELKKSSDMTKIYKLVKCVESYSIPVTWISFSVDHLEKVSTLTNQTHRYGFLGPVTEKTIQWVKTLGKQVFIDADKQFLSKTQVDEAIKQGVSVEAWTVNTLEEVKQLRSLGVVGITSDWLNLSGCLL